MKRLVLDEEDFKKLVNGEVVEKEDVKIILSDIGYAAMVNIIVDCCDKGEYSNMGNPAT